LPQLQKNEALEVGEKIRRAVDETPFEQGKHQPLGKVTLSVGVASYPEDAATLDRLLDSVDSSLYASKRGGRNKVTAYQNGMELHPGRERGPHAAAARRKATPVAVPQASPEVTHT
jgi:predicted signal transduction protein with EAL and GGDEF domain